MITSKAKVNERNLVREMQGIAQRLDLRSYDEALYFPRFVQIETARVCNARCPFCAIDRWDKSVPLMSDKLFDKIVDELSDYSDWVIWVNLQKAGEPLLDKKIVQRVRKVKQAGIKHVNMSTNASLLDANRAKGLLEAGLDELMISIDSVDKEAYEKMRVGLDYETVIENIETFFQLRDEINPSVMVRVRGVCFFDLESNEGRAELARWESFWNRFKKPHDRIYMKKAHNWGNQVSWDGRIPEYDWVYHPCIIPWSTINITAMGKVALCVQDYDGVANLGDINVQSIAEVWRGDKLAQVRKLHQSGNRNQIRLCQGCRLWDDDHSLEKERREKLELYGLNP